MFNSVELRWVVTPDLDGPQLQYRSLIISPHIWVNSVNAGFGASGQINCVYSEWLAVPTVFHPEKLIPKTPEEK